MHVAKGLAVGVMLVVFAACGATSKNGDPSGGVAGSATTGGSAGSGTSGSAAHSAGAATAGGTTASGDSGAAGSADDPVDTDPVLCGGAYPHGCAPGKVCRFDSGCGTVGHCLRVPSGCDENYLPVCGCDGKTYGNECSAWMAGVAAGTKAECPATFECGPYQCATGQYCLDKADQADGPWRYACLTLPAACGDAPTCDCLTGLKSCFVGFSCAEIPGSVKAVCN